MRDNLLHQIRKMALSISCWAIYLTNIDEFIMVTIPVAIMKCHPKIGPWLKWRAEISTPIIVKFQSLGDPSFFCRLILLSMLLCLPSLKVSLTSKWVSNIPLQPSHFFNCVLYRFRQGWETLIKTHYGANLYHKYQLRFLLQYIIRLKWLLVLDTWFLG